ncbi:hypothetical protein AVEN_81466-1 [Araneus ventricosus]|uniref:Uncharacterized protein n=1 Tax=Araneus ventricosus TaxID=182803 RepID=A0A4Y2E4E6_ARAVE|nr:hypothetical protein AVEN_81466-1 [Araneus ventricosus]
MDFRSPQERANDKPSYGSLYRPQPINGKWGGERNKKRKTLQPKLNFENPRSTGKLSVSCLQLLSTGGTLPSGQRRTPHPIVLSRGTKEKIGED